MSKKCDHDACQTPFCPSCGEAMNATPRQQLLAYVVSNQRKLLPTLRMWEDGLKTVGPENEHHLRDRIRKRTELIGKYETWIQWLRQMGEDTND